MAKEKPAQKKKESGRREIGLKEIADMVSPEQAEVVRSQMEADTFGATFLAESIDLAYGAIWSRKGLSRKERSLVTIGALIAMRAPAELDYQIKMGLKNGLTPRQIEEIILQTYPYVGTTAAAQANAAAIQALNSLGIKTKDRSQDD